MIPIRCRTSLDDYKRETWPDHAVQPVKVGDWVRADSGKQLRVVAITHAEPPRFDAGDPQPVLEVELHRP